jgi:gliding motility-associated-like protein
MNCYRLLLIFCLLGTFFANAQEFSNKGKDFWLPYAGHIDGANSRMALYISATESTTGEVQLDGKIISFSVTANQATTVQISPQTYSVYNSQSDGIGTAKGIHVISQKPISLYAHILNAARSGSTLVFPTNVLGKDYVSLNFTQATNQGRSQITVVATEDNTVVEFNLKSQSSGSPVRLANTPYQISLSKGDVYQIQSTTDLTGSSIRSIASGTSSCKPIGVFTGSSWTSFDCDGARGGDNLYQQVFPSNSWGLNYITAPFANRLNDIYRIIVKDPTTQVIVNGITLSSNLLFSNSFYEIKNNQPNIISADKPILVVQYMTSQTCDTRNTTNNVQFPGDPEIVTINPLEQTINNVSVVSAREDLTPPNTNITTHYLNILMKTANTGSLKIDDQLPASAWIQIPNSVYSYLQENVTISTAANPSHNIKADSGFIAVAYGMGNVESYGYNAGTNVIDLNPPITIQNQYAAGYVSYSATCSNSPFKVNLSLTYKPTQIVIDFNGANGLSGTSPYTYIPSIGVDGYDSTYMSNGKTYYLYRIPQVYSFNAAGTYPVKLTTTSNTIQSDGCSNTNTQEFTDNLVVNAPPTADFTITSTGCANTAIALNDLSDGLGRPIVRWDWEFSDATISSVQNPSKTFTNSGNYTAKLTSVTDFGCIATVTKNINLSAKPVAAFTVPALRCENSTINFTDASTIVAGSTNNTITRYNWNLDNGGGFVDINSNASQSTTYTSWGNKDIRLTVESNTGCVSDTFRLSPQFKINPLPQVGFTIPEVCLSAANAVFTDTSKIADGTESGFLYSWKFNNAAVPIVKGPTPAISSAKNPSALYKDTGNYVVTLQVTSIDGCVSTLNSPFVVNGSNPVPSFTVLTNTLCSNDSVRIINTSTVDFGTITKLEIYWDSILNPTLKDVDDNPAPNKTYSTQYAKFFTPASKNVGIKIVAFSGNSSACARSTNQNKSVNGSANITFIKPRDICNEASPRQITQGSFASAVATNTAEYSGIGINSAGLYNPQTVAAGTYVLKYRVTNAAGCKDSASQPITVWPTPEAKWGVQTILCEKNTISFTDSSVANFSNIAQRKWDYGDGFNETRTSITSFNRIYNTAQTYNASLQIITDSGCVSTIHTQAIKVNPLPIPAFTLPTVVCLPDGRATFTNQSSIADGSESLFSYYWNFGNPSDPTPSLLKEPTHKYSALGPVNVQLKVTSKDQCVDSLTKSFSNIYPWPKANMGMNVTTACMGDTVYFADNGNGISSSATSWRWDLSQGFSSLVKNPSRQFNDSGTYTIKYYFFNAQGCVSDTVSRDLIVYPYPKLILPKRVNVLEGGNLMIRPIFKYGTNLSYIWTPSTYLNSPTDSTPTTTPLGDITYRLYLTGIGGCTVNDTIFVKLLLSPIVPNAFSPNGDGINDRWRIQYLESYPGATVDVFNRYGQTVFSSVGYTVDWDGTVNGSALPIGTYYYVINPKNGRKIISGSVTIIR